MRGCFLTLEGPDGSGKTTAIGFLKGILTEAGYRVWTTREPGGCKLSEQIRAMLLSERMSHNAEMLLFAAARAEHLAETVLPAIERGEVVISDRFSDSTYAYQVAGRGMSVDHFDYLDQMVVGVNQPKYTLFFDVSKETSKARLGARHLQSDRFDQAEDDFKQRVWEGYQARFRQHPERMVRIDAEQDEIHVKQQILQWVNTVFIPNHPLNPHVAA